MTADRSLCADAEHVAITTATERGATLRLERDGENRTFIARQFAPYPFHFCRPFYLPGDPDGLATVYAQSSAGGIFEHDRLRLDIVAGEGTQAHITTSASTIVHSMPAGHAEQRVLITASRAALIEYLPDPLILFPQARLHAALEVRLDDGARALLGDALLLHDPRGENRAIAGFKNSITVRDQYGKLLVRDHYHIGGAAFEALPGVMGSWRALGSLFILDRSPAIDGLQVQLRTVLNQQEGVYAGASLLPHGAGVLVRVLGRDGAALRSALTAAWMTAREALTGRRPAPRRK